MRIDILMISNILSTEQSAYYSSASRLITIILIFSTLFFQFIYPNLSRFLNDKNTMDRIFNNIIFLSLYSSILFFVVVLIFGKLYLGLFGKDYILHYYPFIFLSISLFFSLVINLWIQKNFCKLIILIFYYIKLLRSYLILFLILI